MRTVNIGNWPSGWIDRQRAFELNIKWVVAIDSSDFGDDTLLIKLIAGADPIPLELRPTIAAALSGSRKKRNATKSKIPPWERLLFACAVSEYLGWIDKLKELRTPNGEKLISAIADVRGCEPLDILRIIESSAAEWIDECAQMRGVHVETIKNMLRDLRRKMISYPNV